MSRCPYCRRQLPGFETVCQKCFEASYDRVTDTRPWWQRRELWHRPRLTREILHGFLFLFAVSFVMFFVRYRMFPIYLHPSIKHITVFSLVFAATMALIESTRRKPPKDPKQKKAPE